MTDTTKPADNHDYYNLVNFPKFLAQSIGSTNWVIHTNVAGDYCAAIAVAPGCKSTHFGNITQARDILGLSISVEQRNRSAAAHKSPARA